MPEVYARIATEQIRAYMAGQGLPTPPNPGVEVNRLGLMELHRYNMSLTSLELGEITLTGCSYAGRGRSRLEAWTGVIPDRPLVADGVSIKERYLPDSIRLEVRGIRWTSTMRYHVQELGLPLGGGEATFSGKGRMWCAIACSVLSCYRGVVSGA